ncbi:MAG: cytochrome C peroxidase [Symploca sp. SIO2E6]|nr:cytochrome C peroxidase [Symploca sp. SIO2E6]
MVSHIGWASAQTQRESDTIPYLSAKLKQLVKFAAPGNLGLNYFILPNSADLKSIPADPQNPLTPEKVKLGQLLFHETALSINPINPKHWQQSSCASCHFAQAGFRSNLPQALGVGGLGWNKSRHRDAVPSVEIDKQNILTPSVLNSAYQKAMFWDGRAGVNGSNAKEPLIQEFDVNRLKLDGLETQAIDAMTVHKLGTAAIATLPEYQELFAKAFPDRPYVTAEVEDLNRAGFAIAAYERTLLANQAPFQRWLKGNEQGMSAQELRGAIVYFSSSCIHCHTGPNLAITDFKSVGFADHPQDFSGLNLGRGVITKRARDDFKFKVPQLYNLADSSPYGHGASFNTVREVVEYFNRAQPQKLEALYAGNLSIWFQPLHLQQQQVDDLTAFLETGLRDPNLTRYLPEQLPSGLCFPNNDPVSRKQLNCD